VPDDKGNRIMFQMFLNADGEWRTDAENLPTWVHHIEGILADAIREHDESQPIKKR
jgi:hypothetical protein